MTTTNDNAQHDPKYRASGLNEVIAQNVTALRVRRQITQAELGRRTGLGRITIMSIESGRRLVAVNDLPALCFALQCNLADLMRGPEDHPIDDGLFTLGWARRIMLPPREVIEPIEKALRRLIRDEMDR